MTNPADSFNDGVERELDRDLTVDRDIDNAEGVEDTDTYGEDDSEKVNRIFSNAKKRAEEIEDIDLPDTEADI